MTSNNKSTRYFSDKQEKEIAKAIGAKQIAGSGSGFYKGDLRTNTFLIEAKTCMSDKKSFSIKKEWIEKNKEEAFGQGKASSALAFNFGPGQENYYIINEQLFKILLNHMEGKNE